jgi:signal peptidase I
MADQKVRRRKRLRLLALIHRQTKEIFALKKRIRELEQQIQNENGAAKVQYNEFDRKITGYKNDRKFFQALKSTVGTLIVVMAIAAICSSYFLSLIKVEGTSMNPTLEQGELLLAKRTEKFQTGDIIVFYYNNKLLLKRVIAGPGDWVDIDGEGQVYVNNEPLDEAYLDGEETERGDLSYPYQVPESQWFVMGDHRKTSMDSRYTQLGNVKQEQVFGKVLFRIWPLI